jgi:hypothetical protein
MSLPNYLAKIKSAGIYRFVWDKSEIPPQTAETLRLVVGYSEKGPFNTPVYLEKATDFTTIYGNTSKRLERKGVYFHRLATQALAAGPILALNIKPFTSETVQCVKFNMPDLLPKAIEVKDWTSGEEEIKTVYGSGLSEKGASDIKVSNVYDTNRFWSLNPDVLHTKIQKHVPSQKGYVSLTSTDTKENSCTIFVRPVKPKAYEGITIRQWYVSQNLEMPEYLDEVQDTNLDDYFVDLYVFRGKFTKELCTGNGALANYFNYSEWVDANEKHHEILSIKNDYKNIFGEAADALEDMSTDSNSNFIASYTGCTLPSFKDANGNYISLDLKFNLDNSKHKMLMKFDESYLDECTDNDGEADMSVVHALSWGRKGTSIVGDKEVETWYDKEGDEVSVCFGNEFASIPLYLEGYTYTTITKKVDPAEMQELIFGQLKTKGIRTALTNRVDVEYHYIVDTFDSEVAMGCKTELATIAKEKDNCFAILNFPKMSKFVDDKDKRFTSSVTNSFDINLISKGFSLPSEINGASFCGFFTQVTFSDGTVKNVVPSAALVSNNFMEKWYSRQPYYIVAGPSFGRIGYDGMVGPDYNFGRADLDVLEPMGVNAIIYVPRKGTYINSNQTAKQSPVSALSKIHVRELVIYLQNEIETLLQSYQWELNTQTLRDTIKSKADAILDTIMNNGGVYAYKNVCDSSNNTPEIIDNEMIILDTEIEPARGAGKMVHQLTIHRTGGMSSSTK